MEATDTLKKVANRLASKWKQPYSKTCGYVKSRISITLVRSTHRCIRGSPVPAHKVSVQRPKWEDGGDWRCSGKNWKHTHQHTHTHTPLPPNAPHTPMNRAQPAGTIKKTAVKNHSEIIENTKRGQGTPVLP